MSLLVLAGDDYWGRKALDYLQVLEPAPILVLDKSARTSRTLRLIRRRRVSIIDVIHLMVCELRRFRRLNLSKTPRLTVSSNQDLEHLIDKYNPTKVILFRAGIIIKSSVLARPLEVLNIHAASVPEFAGLMALPRAVRSKQYLQNVTLHRVTLAVDQGDVVETKSYVIPASASICEAEDVAYGTAIDLLLKVAIAHRRQL